MEKELLLLEQLRESTRVHHQRLEQALNLMGPGLTRRRYGDVLAGFLGFYEPWERAMAASLSPALREFFRARRKVPALKRDLAWLGLDAAATAAIPRCERLPALTSEPAALGSMYVIEGATLGGKYISRHVRETLRLDATGGGAFFWSYGEAVDSMWKSFQEVLRAGGEKDPLPVLAGAQETFVQLHDWLCGRLA